MSMIMRPLRLATMLALVAACADDPAADDLDDMTEPLPPPDVRGKYLDVYLSDGNRICPPTLERLDSEVERISEALGFPPPDPEERIVVHYGYAAVDERCNADRLPEQPRASGCASADALWIAAQPGTESHELVHHLRQREDLQGPRYWEEGLAVFVGGHRPYTIYDVGADREGDLAASLGNPLLFDPGDYAESAHFIAYIDQTRGSDVLRTLSTTLVHVEPGAAFQQVLGASVQAVEAEWKAESETTYHFELPCESTLEVGEEPVVVRGEIGCDVPGVLGPGPGPSGSQELFRSPLYCIRTPPDSTLTMSVLGSDHAEVIARALPNDLCPDYHINYVAYLASGETRDIATYGCEWSITYVSVFESGDESDEYEIELSLH
jgi:hypothetical protein